MVASPHGAPRTVAIVGATGSIGQQALDVVTRSAGRLRAVALAAGGSWEPLCAAARRCGAEAVALADPRAAARAREELAGSGITVLAGDDGVAQVAAWPSAQVTLAAPSGLAGLRPVLAALEAGRDVALANKESLVAGGRMVVRLAAERGARLLPVDSEHAALFQCLQGRHAQSVRHLWLTASGGPFLRWPAAALEGATPAQALRHPTWQMGPRVTVDSATLANKGLEVMEAAWLFGTAPEAVRVLIHPQSVVHALVEYVDGSWVSQCAPADMRLPIAHALGFPERLPGPLGASLDLAALGHLDFEEPDGARFPALGLAYAAAAAGGGAPAAFNAADEVAVARFLNGEIGFLDIARLLAHVLDHRTAVDDARLEGILEADGQARRLAAAWQPALRIPARRGEAAP
jgi:1-deoxy-D-xylulose-5-phosphate reductoisomerase